jgi:acylphosphatase
MAETDHIRAHLVIEGRVQGVFFRSALRAEAVSAGVAGWTRNLPDGRVEAVLEGPAELVERIVSWCRVGPPGARVDSVDANRSAACGEGPFEIAY